MASASSAEQPTDIVDCNDEASYITYSIDG